MVPDFKKVVPGLLANHTTVVNRKVKEIQENGSKRS
jgi:hypothetical protein